MGVPAEAPAPVVEKPANQPAEAAMVEKPAGAGRRAKETLAGAVARSLSPNGL